MNNIKVYVYFLAIIMIICGVGFTSAYYSSQTKINSMEFNMGSWASPTASPSTGPTREVVINELMWMGSTINSDDEWIELRNMTDSSIDISGWTITKFVTSEQTMLTITSGTIPANGYFLISKFDKDNPNSALNVDGHTDSLVGLRNSNMRIKLYSGAINDGNLVDIADDASGTPLAGVDEGLPGPRKSMSRINTPSDGTIAANWFTSENNSTTYWDGADGNYGTPGGQNE